MPEIRGLSDVPWADLRDAYGPETNLPALLRAVACADGDEADRALTDLYGTVWHQGTVYECTPVAVPFLVQSACEPEVDPDIRAGLAGLLAEIASPTSFVLAVGRGRPFADVSFAAPSWRQAADEGSEEPARDLSRECRAAVAAQATRLPETFASAPLPVQTGMLAVFAAACDTLPQSLRDAIEDLPRSTPNVHLAALAELTLRLTGGGPAPSQAQLRRLTSGDEELLGILEESLEGLPERVKAVQLAKELAPLAATG